MNSLTARECILLGLFRNGRENWGLRIQANRLCSDRLILQTMHGPRDPMATRSAYLNLLNNLKTAFLKPEMSEKSAADLMNAQEGLSEKGATPHRDSI